MSRSSSWTPYSMMMLPALDLRARQPVSCMRAEPPDSATFIAKLGRPMMRESISALVRRYIGSRRYCSPIDSTLPVRSAVAAISRQARIVIPMGFSVSTDAPASIANHGIAGGGPGPPRGKESEGRWRMMEEVRDLAPGDFSWVRPPILNPTTRLAVVANAARGTLSVQGFEAPGGKAGPATAVFRL